MNPLFAFTVRQPRDLAHRMRADVPMHSSHGTCLLGGCHTRRRCANARLRSTEGCWDLRELWPKWHAPNRIIPRGVEAPATGQVSRHWRLGVGVRMPVYVVPRAPPVTAVLERVRAEREDSARLSTLARELLGHRDPPATAATPSASKHECRTHARTSCATAASSGSERQPADDEEACRERRLVGRLWPKWHGPNRIIPRGRRSTPVLREASKHSLQNWWISNANDGKLSPRRCWPTATTPPNRLGSSRPARGWRR